MKRYPRWLRLLGYPYFAFFIVVLGIIEVNGEMAVRFRDGKCFSQSM